MKRWSELDAILEKTTAPDKPGGALGVFKKGRALYLRGYGSHRLGSVDPITSRTMFNLGSISKQFTAFCVLLLQDRRRLSIEDDFRKYLPEFGAGFKGIKIRHLMHHSSGLLSLFDLRFHDALAGAWKPGTPEHIRLLSNQKERNFPAGQEHLYNNDGYFLLAEIVRRCSGMSLACYAEANIFLPLSMTRTRFAENNDLWIPERAQGHRWRGGRWEVAPTYRDLPGPGGLWSCVGDLGLWAHSLREQSLGSPALYRAQLRPGRILRKSPESVPYAAGLELGTVYGRRWVGHAGLDVGFSSEFCRLPGPDLCVVLLRNREEPKGLYSGYALKFLLDKKKTGPKPASKPPAKRKSLPLPVKYKAAAGFYEGVGRPEFWELTFKRKGFRLNYRGVREILVQTRGGRFGSLNIGPKWTLHLEPRADGLWSMKTYWEKKRLSTLVQVGKPSELIPDPRSLVGSYRSPSGKTFALRMSGAGLFYRDSHPNGFPDIRLRWLAPDKLVYTTDVTQSPIAQLDGNGYLQILRNEKGRVETLFLTGLGPDHRNRHIRFQKDSPEKPQKKSP